MPISVSRPGTYEMEVEAWAQQAGDEIARLGVSVDGKLLKRIDVEATREDPEIYRLEGQLESGSKNIGLSFLNDFYQPDAAEAHRRDRNLAICSIRIRGTSGCLETGCCRTTFLVRNTRAQNKRRNRLPARSSSCMDRVPGDGQFAPPRFPG